MDLTEAEIIAEVQREIDQHQARTRAQRILDASRHQYTRWKCRKRGIPVDSERCRRVMQQAEAVMARLTEHRPNKLVGALLGWSGTNGQVLLAEDMESRKLYPFSLPPMGDDAP